MWKLKYLELTESHVLLYDDKPVWLVPDEVVEPLISLLAKAQTYDDFQSGKITLTETPQTESL